MIEPPEIVDLPEQLTAVIHLVIPRAEIQSVMGPAIAEVIAALAASGIVPAGPVFSHHLRMDPEFFDFEVGVPVSDVLAATGRVRPGRLPAASVARTVYRGRYEGLSDAWGAFDGWISAQGLATAPNLWERYVLGPETSPDPAQWRTELNRPLIERA